jgi:hypothetical protein
VKTSNHSISAMIVLLGTWLLAGSDRGFSKICK